MKVSSIRSKPNSKTVQLTKGMLPTGNVSYTKTLSKTLKAANPNEVEIFNKAYQNQKFQKCLTK